MVDKASNRRVADRISLQQAVEIYLTKMSSEGMSQSFTSWLRRPLRDFCLYVQGIDQDGIVLGRVTLEEARSFMRYLLGKRTKYDHHPHIAPQAEGLAPTTIHGYARAIRSFGTFLYQEGYTEENIFEGLKPPKVPSKPLRNRPGQRVPTSQALSSNHGMSAR